MPQERSMNRSLFTARLLVPWPAPTDLKLPPAVSVIAVVLGHCEHKPFPGVDAPAQSLLYPLKRLFMNFPTFRKQCMANAKAYISDFEYLVIFKYNCRYKPFTEPVQALQRPTRFLPEIFSNKE